MIEYKKQLLKESNGDINNLAYLLKQELIKNPYIDNQVWILLNREHFITWDSFIDAAKRLIKENK